MKSLRPLNGFLSFFSLRWRILDANAPPRRARLLPQDLLLLGPNNSRVLQFPIGNLHPQQSSEVSPFLLGDQLNLTISRVQDLKPPTLPLKTCDSRSSDTGTAPSTCNRGLGLTIGASRHLATSPPCRLNRQIFTLLVRESPRCENSMGY
jgi:hypothetical protein